MAKSIFKEIVIVILITLAIALILIIIFYDDYYVTKEKLAPSKVEEYTLSGEMENELKETLSTTSQNIIKTYYIDSSDLQVYEKQNEYDKGKANPFEDFATKITNTNNSTNTNSTNNNTTKNGFFNTTGK